MNKCILTSLTLLFSLGSLFSQTLRAYETAAGKALDRGDYYAAMIHYKTVLKAKPDDPFIWYGYAKSAQQLEALEVAEHYYQMVNRSTQVNQFPELHYQLGVIKQRLGKYQEALDFYEKFQTTDSELAAKAKKNADDCIWAIDLLAHRNEAVSVEVMEKPVNSPEAEFGAFERDDTLYYSSMGSTLKNEHQATPQFSRLMMLVDGEPVEMGNGINVPRAHTAHAAFNSSGSHLYYTLCRDTKSGDINCNIYVRARLSHGGWSAAQKLPEMINLPGYTATDPQIGIDRQGREVLYFTSDRKGGKGGKDIWVSVKEQDGSWQQPRNLGAVNTPQDDISPYWDAAENALYFSSEGHRSLGGYDIFKVIREEHGWSKPLNLGFPINSSYNEIFYTLSEDRNVGYLSSNRPNAKYLAEDIKACCFDIFKVTWAPQQINANLTVYDAYRKIPIPGAKVKMLDSEKTEISTEINKYGNDFSFQLRQEQDYYLVIERTGYKGDTIYLSTRNIHAPAHLEEQVYLLPDFREKTNRLNLKTLAFDAVTKQPLTGATVVLIDKEDNSKSAHINIRGNDFIYPVDRGRTYTLTVTKDNYESLELVYEPESIETAYTFVKKVFLNPIPKQEASLQTLSEYLPLGVYFDHDQPDPGSIKSNTHYSYDDIYQRYYNKKEKFKKVYSQGLEGVQQMEAEESIETFFEQNLKLGYQNLQRFTAQLLAYLKAGNQVELRLKAFASPRAKDEYNQQLTKRRISSLRNYLSYYRSGALLPYISRGALVISHQPFGETLAPTNVSDRVEDARNSIFSSMASEERRVEIIEIK